MIANELNIFYKSVPDKVSAVSDKEKPLFKGIKTSSGGVCCHNAQGHIWNKKSNPKAYRPRDLTYCLHKPECIVTTNPNRLLLIMTITWHFQFYLMNVSISIINMNMVLEARAISCAILIVMSRGGP